MATPIPEVTPDAILVIQITVAWAGEGRCTPKRLGWWDTDLIDEMGGGELLRRLLLKTGAWAALEAVREAARRTDAKARGQMADPTPSSKLHFERTMQRSPRSRLVAKVGKRAEAPRFGGEAAAVRAPSLHSRVQDEGTLTVEGPVRDSALFFGEAYV